MGLNRWKCIDAGSEYCPCYLAEENNCITCTQLQGKSYCDCNWMGVCIYNDFCFFNNKRKDTRLSQEVAILTKEVMDNTMVLSLKVHKHLARLLKQPGSYIFVRNKFSDYYFDIPISIMDSDEKTATIVVAIEVRGIKSQKIMNAGDHLIIRGPYWNGIFGLEHLKTTEESKCLVIARGIAQAPTIPAIRQLLKNKNDLDIIVNKRAGEHNYINDYFNLESIKEIDMVSDEVAIFCRDLMEKNKYDLVFIGGSDTLQNKIIRNIEKPQNTKIVTTNNNVICCGEGICGACAQKDEFGIWIRTCKAQKVE